MVDHMCSKHVRHDMIDVVRNRYYAFEEPTKMNPLKQLLSVIHIYQIKSVIRIFYFYSDFIVAIFQATDTTVK